MAETLGLADMMLEDSISCHGVLWQLSGHGRRLLTPELLNLTSHVAAGRAEAVKNGAHRSVYRVRAGGLDLFWKHAKFNGPRAWGRDLLRGPKAGIEFRRLEELRAGGIPTVTPLAWGRVEGLWPRGSFLVTEAVPNAVTLGEYLTSKAFPVAERREIAVKLADLMARVHAAGFLHTDLHPGNILLDAADQAGDWRLIDVHDLESAGRTLDIAARVKNLVTLNRWFSLRTSLTDRRSFWKAYAKVANLLDAVGGEIERETLSSNSKLWLSRDRRCVTDNKDYRRHDFGGHAGHVRRDAPADAVTIMADPEAAFDRPTTRVLKDSRTSVVAVVRPGDTAFILKRINIKRWYTPVANVFRPSPALRSWLGACALENRQLATPRTYAVTHAGRRGLPREGYLLMEYLPAARTLDEIPDFSTGPLLGESAAYIRRMHERGVSHRDLKASNIMEDGGRLLLIDLVGLEIARRVSDGRRRRDLMRLCVSSLQMPGVTHATRLRWLKVYFGRNAAEWADWKAWWKDIHRRCLGKLKQNKHRGRKVN